MRLLTAIISFGAIACAMAVSRFLAGQYAAIFTGALLAVDFTFVRESRLFSLDALSAGLLMFAVAAFILGQRRKHTLALVFAGLLIGLSASVKLIGGLGLVGILLFLAIEARTGRETLRASLVKGATVVASSMIPVAAFMIALGPSDMLQGAVLDQAHRGFEAFLKLSILAFFGLSVAYALPIVYARSLWRLGASQRAMLCVVGVVLAFMILQPLTFLHHMVFLSPVLAILAGILMSSELGLGKGAVSERAERFEPNRARRGRACKAAFLAALVLSGGLSCYGVIVQDEPAQVKYGRLLSQLTIEDDFVICGDPIIAAYANRRTPPEVVNVAERQHPAVDLDILRNAVVEYDVKVVVVCYFLNDIVGLEEMLSDEGFALLALPYAVSEAEAALDLFQKPIEPVAFYGRNVSTV